MDRIWLSLDDQVGDDDVLLSEIEIIYRWPRSRRIRGRLA